MDVAPPQLYLMTIIVTLLSSEYALLRIVNPRKDPTFVQFEKVSQPHFEGSVRSPLTLLKMGLGSPPGLPKT